MHPVIIVCRIIEEEREVRRQRPQSFLGSDAKEDSKVTISHQRQYLHSKVIPGYLSKKLPQLKSFSTLKVSLANSKAVFGLRVEPSRGALAQSSFPWQVVILACACACVTTYFVLKPSGVQWPPGVGAVCSRKPNWQGLPFLPHGDDHEQVVICHVCEGWKK